MPYSIGLDNEKSLGISCVYDGVVWCGVVHLGWFFFREFLNGRLADRVMADDSYL